MAKKTSTEKKNYNKFNQDFKNSSHIKILKKGKSWVLTKLDLPFYCCLVTKLCSTPVQPCGLSMPGSSVHSQVGILEWVAISCSRDLSNPEIKPASPDSPILLLWATREAKDKIVIFYLKVAISSPFYYFFLFSILKIHNIIKFLSYTGGKL